MYVNLRVIKIIKDNKNPVLRQTGPHIIDQCLRKSCTITKMQIINVIILHRRPCVINLR